MIPLPYGVRRIHFVVAICLLFTIWLLKSNSGYSFPSHTPWNIYSNRPQSYIEDSLAHDAFDFAPIESEAIKSVCSDVEWNKNVVFTCDNSVGGIGNIRNSILNCVRFAISAGGSLVEPKIVLRDAVDTTAIRTGNTTGMDYMFDSGHFRESLRLSCPGLRIYDTVEDVGEKRHEAIALGAETLDGKDRPRTGLRKPEKWRDFFYTWLGEHTTATSSEIAVINFERSYLTYPIYTDGENFAMSFGKILKFRADVRILATKTLLKLAEKYSYDMDLSKPILPNFFFGAHLRTEHDSQKGWPAGDWVYSRFETQSKLYIEQAYNSSLSHIYVASGDLEEVVKLEKNATASNITVTTKYIVLDEEDKVALASLSWDQQGLVDFLVMTKASDFGGVGHSSFAWNIALQRHQYATKKDHLHGPQLLSDELSQVYGKPQQYPEYPSCIWP